jgi:drug/metabolite transporter (DMT)-like permease
MRSCAPDPAMEAALSPAKAGFGTGIAMAGAGAILFSCKAILAKFLYRHGIDAITLMAFRMLFSLPVFALVAVIETRRARARGDRLNARELRLVFALGFAGYYLASFLDFWGLAYINVSLERLIQFLTPTLVLVLSALVLKKSISARQWLAMALGYAGLTLVFWENLRLGGSAVFTGSVLVFGSAASYAIYLTLSGELVQRIGSLRLVAYAMCASTGFTLLHYVLAYPLANLAQPMPVYALSLANALFCTVLPVYLTMFALARIGAPSAAQLSVLGPVSLVFLGWWLLGEPITALQLAGTAVVLIGVWVVTQVRAPPAGGAAPG